MQESFCTHSVWKMRNALFLRIPILTDKGRDAHQTLWQKESVAERECGRKRVWQKESVAGRECGRKRVWQEESVAGRECGRKRVWQKESVAGRESSRRRYGLSQAVGKCKHSMKQTHTYTHLHTQNTYLVTTSDEIAQSTCP